MDPMTIITGAMAVLTPFLKKGGEKISEKVGEDLWEWLKEKIGKKKLPNNPNIDDKEVIKGIIEEAIKQNSSLESELIQKLDDIKKSGNEHFSKVINNAEVNKQVNITNNNGTINL